MDEILLFRKERKKGIDEMGKVLWSGLKPSKAM